MSRWSPLFLPGARGSSLVDQGAPGLTRHAGPVDSASMPGRLQRDRLLVELHNGRVPLTRQAFAHGHIHASVTVYGSS